MTDKEEKTIEELGFELISTEKEIIEYHKPREKPISMGKTIRFYTDIKLFQAISPLTLEEIQAIAKKCKEFGW